MVDTILKEKCTGCKMCGDICPQNAIYFENDEEGFWYPKIDYDKCNNCGLCEKKCPSLHPEKFKHGDKIEVYASWSKKSEVRDSSTSGGIFWEIATRFIESGNIVVGTRWNEDCRSASFCVARNIEELKLIRGSKYIQSDTEGIYTTVKKHVLKGVKVLFCGTPCQNAAMQSFLVGMDENVYYFDFICRCINSPKALNAYVSDMEKIKDSQLISIRQKSKKTGWQSLATHFIFENGEEVLLDRNNDPWIKGFIENDLYTRDSCFSCQYRSLPRKSSDITVGDFWGIRDVSNYDLYKGISVVIINTEKGKEIFDNAAESLIIEDRTIEEVIAGNPAMLKNPKENGKKKLFLKNLESIGFIKGVEEIIGSLQKSENTPQKEFEMDKIKYKARGEIDEELYYYLNYQCKNIIRKGSAKIIPYKNTILDLQDDSKIILEGNKDWEIGYNALRGSRIETLIRLGRNSRIYLNHGGLLFYGTMLDVKDNAVFKSGYFSANAGSVFIVAKKMIFGEDVMIGRNVIIYDSDFHQILNEEGKYKNYPQEVIIEDHVWLTGNININKGVYIKEGCIVANQTVINNDIPEYSLVAGRSNARVIKEKVRWSRNLVKKYEKEFNEKRILLYGYGIEGTKFYKKYKDRIEFIIDNNRKAENIMTFEEFVRRTSNTICNENEWICVIASPNYYDDLYMQVRNQYPNMMIIPYWEV